jgi:hypothetical protein
MPHDDVAQGRPITPLHGGHAGELPGFACRYPSWADHLLGIVEQKKRIEEIDGIGCAPVLITATTEEILERIRQGLRAGALNFPENAGPILWPRHSLQEVPLPLPISA